MKLTTLRSNEPKNRLPVFISNSGRSHRASQEVAEYVSREFDVNVLYVPDKGESKQGTFLVDATELSDLEVEGTHRVIQIALLSYPVAYDVAKPYK